MRGLGTSYISVPDLLVCGFFGALMWHLYSAPRNGKLSRAVAVISAFAIAGVVAVLLVPFFAPFWFDINLNDAAGQELCVLGILLAISLLRWSYVKSEDSSRPV